MMPDLRASMTNSGEAWECKCCHEVGEGNRLNFFAEEEVNHFLQTGCRGFLFFIGRRSRIDCTLYLINTLADKFTKRNPVRK
jgi:hypothetical protein